jgi:subtilisin family serine protease
VNRTRVAVALGAVVTALAVHASTAALADAGEGQSGVELPARVEEKAPRLDSDLARLADATRARGRLVRVEAVARTGRRAELEAAIRVAGGTTSGRYAGLLEARLPVRALEALAAHPAARRLRSPVRPYPQAVAGQGIAATGAGAWHSAQTLGAGVEIAIVDVGFAGWQARQAEGELPAQIVTSNFCDLVPFEGAGADNHGTAVAEIVHELAPAAKLHLVCIDTTTSLGEAKDYVVANDIPIVNHSVGWLNTSRGDGTGGAGTPDAIVADARAHGVLWVNSAGNYAETHWRGTFSDPNSSEFHDFAPGDEENDVTLFEGGCAFLKWDDWPASDQDFDLYLIRRSNDELVDFSLNPQTGSDEPTEAVCADVEDSYYLVIHNFDADASPQFDLIVTLGEGLEHRVTSGSVVEPATSPHTLAAGSVCVHTGEPQSYSSRGPTIDNRIKPDLAGPDANSTVTYGSSGNCSEGFTGTSAAAPHVAGAAALLKQANPSFGPAELQAALEGRTFDLPPSGKDSDSGWGSLALGSAPPAPPSAPVNTALPTVTGLFHQGQTLTAWDGEWSSGGPLFLEYRWFRCDGNGGACVAIAAARSRTYVPTQTDVGGRLKVRVRASNTGGSTDALSSGTAQIQTPLQPPANTIEPSVGGVAQFGQIVSAGTGAWSGTAPLTLSIEWLRCDPTVAGCVVIGGAVSETRQLSLEDIGFSLRVRVTATNPAGSASATSTPSAVVAPPPPGLVSAPTIAGNAVEGQTLSSNSGAWTFATTFLLQWRRCTSDGTTCTDVPGATGPSYTATRADVGSRLQVLVAASNIAGGSTATSLQSGVVASAAAIGPPRRTRLIVLAFSRTPQTPRAGRNFTLVLRVGTRVMSGRAAAPRVSCSATLGQRSLRAAKSVRGGVARCAWAIPKSGAGKRLRTTIVVSEGARSVRRTTTATVRAARLR